VKSRAPGKPEIAMTGPGMLAALAVALALALGPGAAAPAFAQRKLQQRARPSPILILDQDRLFRQSSYGRRVARDLATASRALAAENRRVEGALKLEERNLTAKRATMKPKPFSLLADAFDNKVQRIRREQDAKGRALKTRADAARKAFFAKALPLVRDLLRESGAVVILDSRAILLAAGPIDITDAAISRVDSVLGDGGSLGPVSPKPVAPAASGTAATTAPAK